MWGWRQYLDIYRYLYLYSTGKFHTAMGMIVVCSFLNPSIRVASRWTEGSSYVLLKPYTCLHAPLNFFAKIYDHGRFARFAVALDMRCFGIRMPVVYVCLFRCNFGFQKPTNGYTTSSDIGSESEWFPRIQKPVEENAGLLNGASALVHTSYATGNFANLSSCFARFANGRHVLWGSCICSPCMFTGLWVHL